MSAVTETIVLCDDCGDQCSGDDRNLPAYRIRENRKRHGWIMVGKRDFCEKCAPNNQPRKRGDK